MDSILTTLYTKNPLRNLDDLKKEVYPEISKPWGSIIHYRGTQFFCLVCQCYIGKAEGEVHTKGRKHLQKESDQINLQSVVTYQSFWKGRGSVFWVHQIFFNPSSSTHFFCCICEKQVAISSTSVKQHLNDVSHYNLCKTSSEFLKFCKENSEIGKTLCYYIAAHDNLSTEVTKDKVYTPVTSRSATIETVSCLFEFKKLGAGFYYITSNDNNTVLCQLCSVTMSPKTVDVFQHLNGVQHLEMNHYLLPNFDSSVFCIPCECNVPLIQQNISEHLKKHSQCVLDVNRVIVFGIHKELWAKIALEYQYQKICFRVINNNSVHCIVCNNKCQPSKLLYHIRKLSHQHLFEKKQKTLSTRLTCLKDCSSLQVPEHVLRKSVEKLGVSLSKSLDLNKDNCKTGELYSVNLEHLKEELYPKALQKFNGRVQARGPQGYCLMCRCNVPLKRNGLCEHVGGKSHLKSAASQACVEALEAYHNAWKYLPAIYWAHQIFIQPYSSTYLYCNVCGTKMIYANVQQHIDGGIHRNLCSKTKAFFAHLGNKTEIGKAFDLYAPDKAGELQSSSWSATDTSTEATKPDLCLNELSLFGLNYYYIIQNGDMVSCRLCFQNFKPTIDNATQHFNGVQHLGSSQYLIPNHDFTIFCMVCELDVKNITEHLTGAKHKSCLSDVIKFSAVEVYKHSWGLVPVHYHYQQICFRMAQHRNIKCLFCSCEFDCTRLFEHILGVTHEVMFEKRHTTIARLPCLKDCQHSNSRKDVRDNESETALQYPTATASASGLQSSEYS